MSDIHVIAGYLAGIISISAYIPFVIAILKRRAKPNRATWIIWAFVSGMIYLSYRSAGAESTTWVPLGYTIGSTLIAILSLRYGVGGWSGLDRACLTIAGISGVLWIVLLKLGFGETAPLITLFLNMGIDTVGAIPTLKNVFRDPESEDRLTWSLFLTGSVMNVIAIEQWTFVLAFYPILMVAIIFAITVLTFRKSNIKPSN